MRHLAAVASAIMFAVSTAAAAASLSGTYAGQLVPEGGGAPMDGMIVIVDRGEAVEITLGPKADELMPATNVKRDGDALTFELDPPGDTPNHLAFAVTVRDGTLTGTLTQTRDGQTRTARVAFTKK